MRRLKLFPIHMSHPRAAEGNETRMNDWLDERKYKIEVEKFEHVVMDGNNNTIVILCHYREIIIPYEKLI